MKRKHIYMIIGLLLTATLLPAGGEESLEAALAVGAEIEDLNIYDLGRQLDITDNDDLRIVYINLEKGSRNHLRSFYARRYSGGEVRMHPDTSMPIILTE